MKNTLTLLCLICFLSINLRAANCLSTDLTTTIIKSSVEEVKRSMGQLTYKETTTGQNTKRIYYRNNEIVLIRFIEHDNSQFISYVKDWYFDCKRIIYAEQNLYQINSENKIDFEAMYFINEKLYQWLHKNQPVDTQSLSFIKASFKLEDFIWKMKVENGIIET